MAATGQAPESSRQLLISKVPPTNLSEVSLAARARAAIQAAPNSRRVDSAKLDVSVGSSGSQRTRTRTASETLPAPRKSDLATPRPARARAASDTGQGPKKRIRQVVASCSSASLSTSRRAPTATPRAPCDGSGAEKLPRSNVVRPSLQLSKTALPMREGSADRPPRRNVLRPSLELSKKALPVRELEQPSEQSLVNGFRKNVPGADSTVTEPSIPAILGDKLLLEKIPNSRVELERGEEDCDACPSDMELSPIALLKKQQLWDQLSELNFGSDAGREKSDSELLEMELTNAALIKSQELLKQFSDLNLGSDNGNASCDSHTVDAESEAQAPSSVGHILHQSTGVDTVRVPMTFLMMMAEALAQQTQGTKAPPQESTSLHDYDATPSAACPEASLHKATGLCKSEPCEGLSSIMSTTSTAFPAVQSESGSDSLFNSFGSVGTGWSPVSACGTSSPAPPSLWCPSPSIGGMSSLGGCYSQQSPRGQSLGQRRCPQRTHTNFVDAHSQMQTGSVTLPVYGAPTMMQYSPRSHDPPAGSAIPIPPFGRTLMVRSDSMPSVSVSQTVTIRTNITPCPASPLNIFVNA